MHVRYSIEHEATERTEILCFLCLRYLHAFLFSKASGLTHDVIGSAIEVQKDKGAGAAGDDLCMVFDLSLIHI